MEVIYTDGSVIPEFPESPPLEPFIGDQIVKQIPLTMGAVLL